MSSKVPALLAYLAVTGRPHQRDALAGLLWGEMPDAAAANNLRQALSNLRKLFEPHLLITRDTVAFNRDSTPQPGHGELHRPAAPQQRPAGRPARRPAAPGVDPVPGRFSERLLRARRPRLRGLGAGGAGAAARAGAERPGHAGATAAGQRGLQPTRPRRPAGLLALDPWREEAHRQLHAAALARSGQLERRPGAVRSLSQDAAPGSSASEPSAGDHRRSTNASARPARARATTCRPPSPASLAASMKWSSCAACWPHLTPGC
ncbi:MAG: hypothetical protein V9H69_21370 [Anaerolineae bacterium]